jgi:hypothetical protein
MICPACTYYRPMSQSNPITSTCAWRPTQYESDVLDAILPAPVRSRALVMPAPHQVEACGAYQSADATP